MYLINNRITATAIPEASLANVLGLFQPMQHTISALHETTSCTSRRIHAAEPLVCKCCGPISLRGESSMQLPSIME